MCRAGMCTFISLTCLLVHTCGLANHFCLRNGSVKCSALFPKVCQLRLWGEVWEIGVAHHVEPCVAVGLLACSKWAKKNKLYYGFSVADVLVPILQ